MIKSFRENMAKSPEYARFTPFLVFVVITFIGGLMGGNGMFWCYMLKVGVGAWLIWEMRAFVPEMRWSFSWPAVGMGILVFGVWVGLDPFYPKNNLLFTDTADSIWNPFARFATASASRSSIPPSRSPCSRIAYASI